MKTNHDRLKLIPPAFALGFIPLIVRLHIYDSGFENFDWFPASEDGIMYDFFLYYKAFFVLVTAGLMLIIMLLDLLMKKRDLKALYTNRSSILLFVYFLFVIISAVFSAYPTQAFLGTTEVFEGAFVISAYMIFFMYTYIYVRDETDLKTLLKCVFPGLVIMLVISFSQIISRDIMAAKFAKALIVPSSFSDLRGSLILRFAPGVCYGTLYNSNYVVQYAGFAFFICLSLMFSNSLRKPARILAGVLVLFSLMMVIRADSRSGLIAFFSALLLYLILAVLSFSAGMKNEKKAKALMFSALAVVCLVTSFIALRSGIHKKIFDVTAGSYSGDDPERLIEDVQTGDDFVTITLNGRVLELSCEQEGEDFFLDMKDEEGHEPKYHLSADGTRFCLTDPCYAGMEIFPVYCKDRLCMAADVDGKVLVFSDFGEEEGYLYYNNAGKFSKFHRYEKSRLFPDGLFTDRGHIWNYCLKLLPKTFFKGFGANTFVYVYPNDDDYYRLYDPEAVSYYDVKAHSMYFQQAVENGLPALVFFVFFWGLYFVRSVVFFVSNRIKRDDLFSFIRFGILAGSVCYMIAGFANDSNVNTAPVFWILMGIGVGTGL